jgi:hypothetical protein
VVIDGIGVGRIGDPDVAFTVYFPCIDSGDPVAVQSRFDEETQLVHAFDPQ